MKPLARLLGALVLLVSAVAGTLVLTSGPAAAGCAEPTFEMLEGVDSDLVFAGVVTSQMQKSDDVITTVRVDRVYKGEVTRRVDVVSSAEGANYSVDARAGDRLIVYGLLEDGEVTSSACRSVPESGQYYEQLSTDLGEGTEPSPGYMKAERRTLGLSYDQFIAGRAVLGVVGLVFLGYFAFRFWRARRRTA